MPVDTINYRVSAEKSSFRAPFSEVRHIAMNAADISAERTASDHICEFTRARNRAPAMNATKVSSRSVR